MSSKEGYAPPPRHDGERFYGGDRFYNPPAVRHQQQILVLQQQHQQMMLVHHQHPIQTIEALEIPESLVDEAEKSDDDAVPPSIVAPAPASEFTNLDRLMESVTPFVAAQYSTEVNAKVRRTREVDRLPFFCLEDLWESFNEWSVYGAGVPLFLNGNDPIQQYYVPFLSGIELYIDPSKTTSQLRGTSEETGAESFRLTTAASNSYLEAGFANSNGQPTFQYVEHELPHNRKPLADKISALKSQYPELSTCRSYDLLPSSWICVAWYPIYRIPVGPTLQDLDASFLTFHSLSTQSTSNSPPQFHAADTRKVNGITDPTAKISLPVFALASYKLQGSILSPCEPHECDQENSLLEAANSWLRGLQVKLPDYDFYRRHYYSRR